MKTTLHILLAGAAVLWAQAVAVSAAPNDAPTGPAHRRADPARMAERMIERNDRNQDQALSEAELTAAIERFQQRMEKRRSRWDEDRRAAMEDGLPPPPELPAAPPRAPQAPQPAELARNWLAGFDANKSQRLEIQELEAALKDFHASRAGGAKPGSLSDLGRTGCKCHISEGRN